MARRYGRNRFGGGFRRRGSTVLVSSPRPALKKGTCKACLAPFAIGDTVVRLRLKKHLRTPCTTCSHKLLGVRWYHEACVPADPEAAMGYVPHAAPPAPDPYAPPVNRGGAVPPPPKPPTPEEAALLALAACEKAIMIRAAAFPKSVTDEVEAKFKTYQNLKARALRPGTPAEGATALKLALTHCIKLTF